MKRRTINGLLAGGLLGAASAGAQAVKPAQTPAPGSGVVKAWNAALLASIARNNTPPTIAARAIAMLHEAGYNAFASLDTTALPSLPGVRRVASAAADPSLQAVACSHAAAAVLSDLYPNEAATFQGLLAAVLPADVAQLPGWQEAVLAGQLAAAALLQMRHADGSNQLGNLAPGAYADHTGYQPFNSPDLLNNPLRWQPLRVPNAQGVPTVQRCLTPHWGLVRPFALASGHALRPAMAHAAPSPAELEEVLNLSARLTDEHKAIAEYWAGGPGTVTPPGMWAEVAGRVSIADGNTLAADVKMFFAVGQALLDASIAAWDAKRAFDSVRPITSVRLAYAGQMVRAWGGPGAGRQLIRGEDWLPYQPASFPTPPFPEFVSGHSTFSAAAATVLAALRGDNFKWAVDIAAGSSTVEANTPHKVVKLRWSTLSEAAVSAGLSRRYGGIHFAQGDLAGRSLGRAVGQSVLAACQALFAGQPGR